MGNAATTLILIVQSLKARPLANGLACISIAMASATLVLVISIISSLTEAVLAQFDNLSGEVVTLSVNPQAGQQRATLMLSDIRAVQSQVNEINALSAVLRLAPANVGLVGSSPVSDIPVQAVEPPYLQISKTGLAMGRSFNVTDINHNRSVAIIGANVAERLGLGEPLLNGHVEINDHLFTIIGVAKPFGAAFGINRDDFILIPLTTGQGITGGRHSHLSAMFILKDTERRRFVENKIRWVIQAHRSKFDTLMNSLSIMSSETVIKAVKQVARLMNLSGIVVVGVSLIIGGLGITNLMILSVAERTKEIGILRAIGAERRFVQAQFLGESFLICLLGGLLGVAAAYSLLYLISIFIPMLGSLAAPWQAYLIAILFSVITGILFGVIPAARAAAIDPAISVRMD